MFVDIAALFINVLFYGKFPNELILGTKPVERLVLIGIFATVLNTDTFRIIFGKFIVILKIQTYPMSFFFSFFYPISEELTENQVPQVLLTSALST